MKRLWPFLVGALSIALVMTVPIVFAQDTSPAHPDGTGVCGEPAEFWHSAVIDGCAAGMEHGDQPPQWIADAGYVLSFHGDFNTSPIENTSKHAAMKGFRVTFDNADLYFRIHAASNPLDRSARFHSYEVFARDPAGNVSHWEGWYNTGDPNTDRIPRRSGSETTKRPVMLVVDQVSWDQGERCEQWYGFTTSWSWDLGWGMCNATTLYQPDENASAADQSTWVSAPDGSLGTTRRLEAAWYGPGAPASPDRGNPPKDQDFWATQFGEIVAGPDDPRCSQSTAMFGTDHTNVCLQQYIASTMPPVTFPGNSEQKEFDASGVHLPN
jgi:hypothetical protein